MNKSALALVRKDGRALSAPAEQSTQLPGWIAQMNEQTLFTQQFTQQVADVAVIKSQVTTILTSIQHVAETQKVAERDAAIIRASIDERLHKLNAGQEDLVRRVTVLEGSGFTNWNAKKLAQAAGVVTMIGSILAALIGAGVYAAIHFK